MVTCNSLYLTRLGDIYSSFRYRVVNLVHTFRYRVTHLVRTKIISLLRNIYLNLSDRCRSTSFPGSSSLVPAKSVSSRFSLLVNHGCRKGQEHPPHPQFLAPRASSRRCAPDSRVRAPLRHPPLRPVRACHCPISEYL